MNPMTKLSKYLLVSLATISPALAKNQDVILVTSPELAPSWKPFAAWKQKLGKTVKIITTDEISKQYKGTDIQEKIRLCVRDNIDNNGTKWVILGGDSQPGGKGIVPDRDTFHKTRWGQENDIPTDIYYISPTNWDADGDGIYGEFKDDKEAISYPDGTIGLGRIPVRTAADIAAYTAKVISYETNYPKGDFGKTITYTCAVPGAYPKVRRSWDDHVSKVMKDGKMNRYFLNSTPWDKDKPGDFPLNPANISEMLNTQQSGKFHIHGHGLLHGWALEQHTMFTKKDVAKLTNKDAYPIITTVSCFTGHYDALKDPCITESMLRAPNAGAIAIVAPCREGKPHFMNPQKDFRLMTTEGKMDGTTTTMTLFWEKGIGNKLSTGEALMQAKAALADNAKKSVNFHMCLSEINLLGDPTIAVQPETK